MTRHNWVRSERTGTTLYYCFHFDDYRERGKCGGCSASVEEKELIKWTNFLPKELNAALDEIVGVRQQIKKELTA